MIIKTNRKEKTSFKPFLIAFTGLIIFEIISLKYYPRISPKDIKCFFEKNKVQLDSVNQLSELNFNKYLDSVSIQFIHSKSSDYFDCRNTYDKFVIIDLNVTNEEKMILSSIANYDNEINLIRFEKNSTLYNFGLFDYYLLYDKLLDENLKKNVELNLDNNYYVMRVE